MARLLWVAAMGGENHVVFIREDVVFLVVIF